MGYVRDDKTGKFAWVEGVGPEEDSPYTPPGKKRKPETSPTTVLLAVVILGAVGLLGVWGMRAFQEPSVPIRRIHNHPAEFDGHQVLVRGRVGEVFEVGGGYAYYLLQDRDTIVVFTRGARPLMQTGAEVRGSVSIGYLDGVARPALFANGPTN